MNLFTYPLGVLVPEELTNLILLEIWSILVRHRAVECKNTFFQKINLFSNKAYERLRQMLKKTCASKVLFVCFLFLLIFLYKHLLHGCYFGSLFFSTFIKIIVIKTLLKKKVIATFSHNSEFFRIIASLFLTFLRKNIRTARYSLNLQFFSHNPDFLLAIERQKVKTVKLTHNCEKKSAEL